MTSDSQPHEVPARLAGATSTSAPTATGSRRRYRDMVLLPAQVEIPSVEYTEAADEGQVPAHPAGHGTVTLRLVYRHADALPGGRVKRTAEMADLKFDKPGTQGSDPTQRHPHDDKGLPSVMVRIPKFKISDVIVGGSSVALRLSSSRPGGRRDLH
jgi:hypothetical protein